MVMGNVNGTGEHPLSSLHPKEVMDDGLDDSMDTTPLDDDDDDTNGNGGDEANVMDHASVCIHTNEFLFDFNSQQDIPFTQPPSPPAHAELDPQPPLLPPEAQLSDPPFAVPPELLAAATSFPPQNIQAVLSLHKALTQHLSGLGYESLKQGSVIDPSPSRDTTIADATETPNNERTLPLFRFHNNGSKVIKRSGKRTYYKCSEANCPATYTLTKFDNSGGSPSQTRTFSLKPHNHLPPPKPPINPEVKERSIAHMRVGASPANVHKHLVQEAPLPLSSSDVPTPGMLRKWKYRDAHKDSESSIFLFLFLLLCLLRVGRRCHSEHHGSPQALRAQD
jgi:hypothetical protein